jgi:uncharacterized protein YoxC
MFIIFSISAIFIAISIVYATFNYVRDERVFRRYQKKREEQARLTIIDISTTCNKIKENAESDNKTLEKLTKELEVTRKYLEKYH